MSSPTAGIGPSCAVELDRLEFGYGKSPVLAGVSLAVPAGAFVTVLGPSGCGKTTLLKLIAGYLLPIAGHVKLRGDDALGIPVERRNIGFVFQNFALFPHLSARGNVEFPLRVRGLPQAEMRSRVEAMLDRVRLPPAERDRLPPQLSGGQQQRVALARALVFRPDVLLLDEPFANLDRHLRGELRDELAGLQRELNTTMILVTHEYEEALVVSDLIGVLLDGRIQQFATPQEIYHRPITMNVARAVGEVNVLPGELVGRESGRVVLIRPEEFYLGEMLLGCVTAVQFHGPDAVVTVVVNGFRVIWRTRARGAPAVGDTISLTTDSAKIWEFPKP